MPVDVSQLLKLAASLNEDADRVGRETSAEVRRTAKLVEGQARANAPVGRGKTAGELRGSIDTKIFGTGNGRRVTAVVRAGTDHGRLVEEGTSRQPPQPFMRPAVSKQAPGFVAGIAKVIGKV